MAGLPQAPEGCNPYNGGATGDSDDAPVRTRPCHIIVLLTSSLYSCIGGLLNGDTDRHSRNASSATAIIIISGRVGIIDDEK